MGCGGGGTSSSPSQLHVVETNPFRHLNHLSLKLVQASDLCLRKYLAKCLLQLKVSTLVALVTDNTLVVSTLLEAFMYICIYNFL